MQRCLSAAQNRPKFGEIVHIDMQEYPNIVRKFNTSATAVDVRVRMVGVLHKCAQMLNIPLLSVLLVKFIEVLNCSF